MRGLAKLSSAVLTLSLEAVLSDMHHEHGAELHCTVHIMVKAGMVHAYLLKQSHTAARQVVCFY